MNSSQSTRSSVIIDELRNCKKMQYSGALIFKNKKGNQWKFYCQQGKIIWATGGTHLFRCWRRQMAQCCSEIDIDKMQFRSKDLSVDYWGYQFLQIFLTKQKIKQEQMNAVVQKTIAEMLFDVAQQANFTSISCAHNPKLVLKPPMGLTDTDMLLQQMEESWKNWVAAGIANFSPNFAPVLRKPEELKQKISPSAYQNFVTLMDGKKTLRDLGVKLKKSVLPLTQSLLPYIRPGIIELIPVGDLPLKVTESNNQKTPTQPQQKQVKTQPQQKQVKTQPQQKQAKKPVVACVDDSPQIGQILQQVLTPQGMDVIAIQDTTNALTTLLQHKPNLIFLDLIMPVVNGYELCAQLRKISLFNNVPIIILTGSDRVFDRVRAKSVGCNDFISKPIVADKVIDVTKKYIRHQSLARN